LGGEYILRTGEKSFIKFTGAVAKSYRVPTFNDRYWGTQGNPNLKPEEGMNYEAGAAFHFNTEKVKSTVGMNAFYMDVENWIEWRNFGEWRAENVQEVVSKGVEFRWNSTFPFGIFDAGFTLNYTFNRVEPVATIEENGLLNRQMNYVPKQMGNSSFELKYKKLRFFADGQFTGKRFTDDFGNELPAYFIANCGVGYKLAFGKQQFDLVLSANNIFDTDYQNQKYYAMPGRYFRVGLKYEFDR
jgi:iron complex outermembrane receptor protein